MVGLGILSVATRFGSFDRDLFLWILQKRIRSFFQSHILCGSMVNRGGLFAHVSLCVGACV